MRQILTLLLFAFVTVSLCAQFTFQEENMGPFVGDQWASYNFILPIADNPLPAQVGETSYDYAFLGDIVEEEQSGNPFKDVDPDSLINVRVLDAPTDSDVIDGEDFGFPAYGDNVLQLELFVPAFFNEEDDEGSLRSFIRKDTDGLYSFGQAFFNFEEGGIFFIDTSENQALDLPYNFAPGDSVRDESFDRSLDSDFGVEDSLVTITSFVYLGNVSLTTHFGPYENVALVRSILEFANYRRDLDSEDPYILSSIQREVSYGFFQEGNAAPLIDYTYSFADPMTLEPISEDVNISFNQPRTLVNVADAEAAHIQLSVFPNPTSERVTVAFEQAAAQDVQVVLRDVTGRQLARRAYGNLLPGSQRVNFDLPRGLPVGSYLLQVVSGQATTARVLAVRR